MKKQARPTKRNKAAAAIRKSRPVSSPAATRSEGRGFPIVGIGASAGGLEALEQFLRGVPESPGMAFVIVQHMDPTHKGIMAELLQRATAMKVLEVKDGATVQPDRVFVIPPNKDMSILHGVLHLLEPVAPRGLRLPIDFFFRALAGDAGPRGVGVVLSGMGTDGTIGLRAIKRRGGTVFVQEPSTAKFDGMPRSAIDAGVADMTGPPNALPGMIIAYLHRAPRMAKSRIVRDDEAQGALGKVLVLLRGQSGHDFFHYKKSTVYRRIERRMGIHRLKQITAYVKLLRENPQELDLLFKEMLIGVTSFFRDPEVWETLKSKVIPMLLKDRPPSQALRVWIPGCATGEEAYSMAMVLKEAAEQSRPHRNLAMQIFATDLDRDAIERARTGVYPANIAADVATGRLERFFVTSEQGFQVCKVIRESVIFAAQNLIMDPPFTRLDLLSCRNLLIYLTPEVQKKLLPLFHYSLRPGGYLVLGSAETVGGFGGHFATVHGRTRIYRRLESDLRAEPIEFPVSFASARAAEAPAPRSSHPPANLQSLTERLLLQRHSPAAVLVNKKGDILFISGRTGMYLEPAAGKANWNLFAMARDGLRSELNDAFQKALRTKETVTRRQVRVLGDAGAQTAHVTVEPLAEPEALRGLVMVIFEDTVRHPRRTAATKVKGTRARNARIDELELDLEQAGRELRTTRDQMQSSQEELKSANEELQSTNEELQSTNEELTTAKEEMQSMNEELQTLNAELQAKVDDLSRLNNDMSNLLNSTEIATIFLDAMLCVRFFTVASGRISKLIPGDVGRPITDIASELTYPNLAEDAREVIRTLAIHQQEVAISDGRWFQVRILPYRTMEDHIDGVVITFTEITASKLLESELRRTQAGMATHIAEQDMRLKEAGDALQTETRRRRDPGVPGGQGHPKKLKGPKP